MKTQIKTTSDDQSVDIDIKFWKKNKQVWMVFAWVCKNAMVPNMFCMASQKKHCSDMLVVRFLFAENK